MLVLVDYEKAFDTVNHPSSTIRKDCRIDHSYTNLIEHIYKNDVIRLNENNFNF